MERGSFSEFRLPPGRHGIPPEEVAENQRWRLLGAAAEVLAEHGPVRTTSTRIAKRAGVSPATFYQHFEHVGDCLRAAYEAEMECIWNVVSDACKEKEIEWQERLGVAVASALRVLAVEPEMAHLVGAQAPSGVEVISKARDRAVDRLAELLATGRSLRPKSAATLPAATERHLVAGAFSILGARISAGDAERLPELTPQLTEMLSAPYTGST